MTEPSIEARIAAARSELEETLDAIEDKLNLPKRVGRLARKARASYDDNPVPWIAAAAAVVVAIGGLVAWALLRDD